MRAARRAGHGSRAVSPPRRHNIGRMNASNTTSDDVGNPGIPITGLAPARATSVGLPGRMSMPWNRMPGGSATLSNVVLADGLVLVEAATPALAAGDAVEVLLY